MRRGRGRQRSSRRRDRDLYRINDLGNERHGGDLSRVAACFRSLGDHGIEAAVFACLSVADRAADVHYLQAGSVEAIDEMAWRYAQPRDERGGAFLDDDVGGFLERLRNGGKQVNAKGLLRQLPHLSHLGADFTGAAPGHAKRSKAAGLGYCSAHFSIGNAAHSRQKYGVPDTKHVTKRCLNGHGSFPKVQSALFITAVSGLLKPSKPA